MKNYPIKLLLLLLSISLTSCSSDDEGADSGDVYDQMGLTGKWMNLEACQNDAGESSYFIFNRQGNGIFFNSDCNSSCAGYGITFYFDFSYSGANVLHMMFNDTDDYCGMPIDVPEAEDVYFILNNNKLDINGVLYTKID